MKKYCGDVTECVYLSTHTRSITHNMLTNAILLLVCAQSVAPQLLALALLSHEGGRTEQAWLHELNLLSDACPLADRVHEQAKRCDDEKLLQVCAGSLPACDTNQQTQALWNLHPRG